MCLGSGFGCGAPFPAGVLGGFVCLCACSACTLPLLARVCGVAVCAWARVSAAPRHSWLGCSGVCVCLCARSACAPPLLAGLCGIVVCVWAPFLAAPRHLWRGCWGVCVFVCALRFHPTTPGWGVRWGCVCLGSGSGCVLPHLAGVLGCVCVCVRAPLVPRHSWLGWTVCVCELGLGFWLHAATPGWAVGVCVCVCARSACTPPLLAGVCSVGVCVWAPVSAALRHSWLKCPDVCVFVCALCLYPATPGRGVLSWSLCLCSGFRCALPLLARVLGCVCVCVRAPLVPHHSWLGCPVWVCVLGFGFQLRSAIPGWGVGVCVCLCARYAYMPPLLAAVCGVDVCTCTRVSAPPRQSWLRCWGVCVFVCTLGLYPASPGLGVRCVGWLVPGTCSCAMVRCGMCALPWFAAPWCCCCLAPVRVPWLWPAACLSGVPRGPALVRRASSVPVALVAMVGFSGRRGAFLHPGGLCPRIYWAAARGTWRLAEKRAL